MTLPIFYIKDGYLSFGTKTILDNIEIYIKPGDKICLIGRNGSGKSSLLKIINQDYELNVGEMYFAPNIEIDYLIQNFIDYNGNALDFMLLNTKKKDFHAKIFLDKLQIPNVNVTKFSGGMKRKLLLAKSLMKEPDILMLDEPTNHLDIDSIEWLENYIQSYKGSLICISHDKEFLSNITNKIWWIDRGLLRKSERGYKYFEEWQEEILNEESTNLYKLGKKLAIENQWLTQGVKARRKRNQGRIKEIQRIREQYRNVQNHRTLNQNKIDIELQEVKKSKLILEAKNISYSIDTKPLIQNFSIRIQKGEKIGIIGSNGVGKTSLIKLLIGELKPQLGIIKHNKNTDITYFDQHRTELNLEHTIKETLVPQGGEYIFFNDREMHVGSYLKRFVFDPKSMHDKVVTLSGGERNRLLLAKKLINPGNLLVLDEPTNDLDMDSLEMLIDYLYQYTGTLIIVSHDRDFLEKLVTRTIIMMNDSIENIIGSYKDYRKVTLSKSTNLPTKNKKNISSENKSTNIKTYKLSYNEKRLLEILPVEIEKLQKEILKIESILALEVDLYNNNKDKFFQLTNQLKEKQQLIISKEEEWLKIEEIRSNLDSNQ